MDNFNLKKFLVENKMTRNSRLLAENNINTFEKAGFNFDDGILGGVGSGGGGYYDYVSDQISGYNIDKFDEKAFDDWYDSFSKDSFNNSIYDEEEMEDYDIDFSKLPKGVYPLDDIDGAAEVTEGGVILYAYPTLSDLTTGEERFAVFGLDNNGKVVAKLPKEEVKAKLITNKFSLV
jgi:hypothetical protein